MNTNTVRKLNETESHKNNVIYLKDVIKTKSYVPEGYSTGRIFRKDRSLLNNIKRFWLVFARDNIYPYLPNQEDSKYYLIKDRRNI